jgi:hypothetical protein
MEIQAYGFSDAPSSVSVGASQVSFNNVGQFVQKRYFRQPACGGIAKRTPTLSNASHSKQALTAFEPSRPAQKIAEKKAKKFEHLTQLSKKI